MRIAYVSSLIMALLVSVSGLVHASSTAAQPVAVAVEA